MTTWTKGVENVLNSIRINSFQLSQEYQQRYLKLKKTLRFYKIPLIVLNSTNAVISVGYSSFLIPSNKISMIVCIISLLCGIIGSIELFFSLQKQMETDLEASKSFYILSISIYKMLSLEIPNRCGDSRIFLEETFNEYTKLIGNSNVIEKKILDNLTPIPLTIDNLLGNSNSSNIYMNNECEKIELTNLESMNV